MRNLGSVFLADAENKRLAHLAAYRIFQGIFNNGFAEHLICFVGKEFFLKVALEKSFFGFFAFFIFNHYRIALFRKKLRGNVGTRVNGNRIDEVAVFYAIKQGISERRLAARTAKSRVGIQ